VLGRGKSHDDRSAAERAAAAAERARRRGTEPPPMPVDPDPEPVARESEPEPAEPEYVAPEPVHVEPEPVHVEPEPAHAEPEPRREPEPEPVALPRLTPVQRPAAPRRAAPSPRPAPPLRARPRRPPRPLRRPPPTPAPGGSRARRRVLAGGVLLLVAVAVWLAVEIFQPWHGDATGLVRVSVPAGAGAGEIGDLLEARGVVASGTFFALNATVTSRRGGLRPGDYTLQRDMRYGTVLDALTKGPKAKVIKTFDLTLPEGLSRKEMAPVVAEGGVDGDYLEAASAAGAVRRAHALGLPPGKRSTEGFLFPATYALVRGASAQTLVKLQLSAFADNFSSLDLRRARRGNLTRYDVLIIASMIEREAQLDRERPLIAAVIYNRLSDGTPLAIDATTRYEYGNWDRPLLRSQLETDGPYNTRTRRGLPPTPIGNPGLASLEAAARPANVDYRFYVVKPGTCGQHAFSSTDADFQEDLARYNAARERAGGRSPTTC